jgi:hypothetical protein
MSSLSESEFVGLSVPARTPACLLLCSDIKKLFLALKVFLKRQ